MNLPFSQPPFFEIFAACNQVVWSALLAGALITAIRFCLLALLPPVSRLVSVPSGGQLSVTLS